MSDKTQCSNCAMAEGIEEAVLQQLDQTLDLAIRTLIATEAGCLIPSQAEFCYPDQIGFTHRGIAISRATALRTTVTSCLASIAQERQERFCGPPDDDELPF